MIVKLIRMNRRQRRASTSLTRRRKLQRLRHAVFGLTRYIVDADPYSLIEAAETDILSITDYAVAVEHAGVEPGEKVEAFGCRNLVSNDLAAWQAQMLSVAARAPKVRSPVLHIILSLPEKEEWKAVEREEAIDIVLETLRLERCPAVWAHHSNTPNPHLHLSVVRVDPRTGQAAGSDWLIDDLHQACALIEERQGRAREPQALYVAREGAVYDVHTDAMVRDRDGRYLADWYKGAGKKRDRLPAMLRRNRAEIVAAGVNAQSWAELHEAFAERGITYDRSGSGARIGHGSHSVKASEIHASLSRGKLEERLGTFEPDIQRLDADYEAFRHAQDEQLAELRAKRNHECARLGAWASATIESLQQPARAVLRPSIRAEALEAKKSLQEAFADAIKQCTDQRKALKDWNSAGRPPYRKVSTPALLLPVQTNSIEQACTPSNRFQTRGDGWATTYLDDRGSPLFTDQRVVIVVHRVDQLAAVDEALRLGAARWGSVSIRGPDAFLELAAARAAVLGITVVGQNGTEVPAARSATPVPEAPKGKASAEAARSSREDDQSIDRAIRMFADHPTLLLRRREERGDTEETGRTGPLEVVLKETSRNAARREAIFSSDQRVQSVLETRRTETLNQIRAALSESGVDRCPSNDIEVLELLRPDEKLLRAATVMQGDQDLHEMLREVRQQMLCRTPAGVEFSAVSWQAFQNSQGKGR